MLIDARSLPRDQTVETDLCIVGAGAVGIAIALELVGRRIRVALLESGGFEAEEQTQRLYHAESVGRPYHKLLSSRTRLFGGSTSCWEGFVGPWTPSTSARGSGSRTVAGP
jgi:choline dehydrogenase-like flavoprotein